MQISGLWISYEVFICLLISVPIKLKRMHANMHDNIARYALGNAIVNKSL